VNRAVFLDRDGVINRVILRDGLPYSPATLEDLEILPGVSESIRELRDAEFRIIIATNQPDVGRGSQRVEVVEAMHERINQECQIDAFKVCYHDDEAGCLCRKPLPGMLLEAATEWSLDLEESFMLGDRWRDIEAGKAAGCKTVLIGGGYLERVPENPNAKVDSLYEASNLILSGYFGGR